MAGSRLNGEGGALSEAFYKARKAELRERLKPARYEHTLRVAQSAVELARLYGVDERKARLAGLLHDWDKGYDDAGIRKRACDLGIDADAGAYAEMPALLHGPTAAAALARDHPSIPADVLRAVEVHTTGDVGMGDLDMVVYVADAIEPGRDYGGLDAVRDLAGRATLEELFLATFQHIFLNLVQRRKRVYPRTPDVWNHYLARAKSAAGAEGKPKKGKA